MFSIFEVLNEFNQYHITVLSFLNILCIISGILTVITKNPILSVLYLISLFSNISVYLIMIGMAFMGLSYLLVYVGAVSILFLFILMLINIRVSELISNTNNNIPLAGVVVICFFAPIDQILPTADEKLNKLDIINQSSSTPYIFSNNWDNNLVYINDITSIGNIMYTTHYIWLIIASIILLLAMVGSIIITIKQRDII